MVHGGDFDPTPSLAAEVESTDSSGRGSSDDGGGMFKRSFAFLLFSFLSFFLLDCITPFSGGFLSGISARIFYRSSLKKILQAERGRLGLFLGFFGRDFLPPLIKSVYVAET
jgi:hypothetical protein